MTREPAAPPNTWGKANVGMTDQWFDKRVSMCRSIEHLKAAIEAEIERGKQPDREVRRERIGKMNKRLKRIKALQ